MKASSHKKQKSSLKSVHNKFSINVGGAFIGSQSINPYSGITNFSQVCSTPMQNNTQNKPFQYGSHSLHLAKQHQLQAFLSANCTYHASQSSYFQIFNKNDKKCQLLVPDTILLSSGVISNWYFSSKPSYEVLKKRPQKLQILQATAVLIKQAVIIAMANGGVKAVSQFWYENQQIQLDENTEDTRTQTSLPPIQLFNPKIKDPDFTLPPGGLLKHLTPNPSLNSSSAHQNQLNYSNTNNSIRNQFKSLSELNKSCLIAVYQKPIPVAYCRYHSLSQKGRIISSKQLYHTLKQSGSQVKMIQSFIPQRAKQTSYRLVCDYLNIFGSDPPQYVMIRERASCAKQQDKKQKLSSAGGPTGGSRGGVRIGSPATSSVGGSGMKSRANSPKKNKAVIQHDDYNPLDYIPIKSFDLQTNDKIKNEMKRFIIFIQSSNNIVVRRFKACFVRDVSDSIYFVGGKQLFFNKFQVPQGVNSDQQMMKDLQERISQLPQDSSEAVRLTMQQAQLQQKMRQKISDQPKDPFQMTKSMKMSKTQVNLSGGIFGVSKIPGIKQNQRISANQRCQGDFCVYRQNMDEIRNNIKSRKKKQFQTKTDKSKIPLNNFTSSYSCTAFSIPTLLIKKVRDNHQIIGDILDAHCIQRIDDYQLEEIEDRELLEILKGVNPDCKFGGPLYETVQKIRRTNYQNLYTALKVCKNCYSVYTLLRQYFQKIQLGSMKKTLAPKFKPDDRLKQITQATRFLQKISANPKHDIKNKTMTRLVKSQSVAKIAQANQTQSGGMPIENWIHTQKLVQQHKIASIFNVTRNPFQRELRVSKTRSARRTNVNQNSSGQQYGSGANDLSQSGQLLKNIKNSPIEKDVEFIKDGQVTPLVQKNALTISKLQGIDYDVFEFEKINSNKDLSKQLSHKILNKLESLKQHELQNRDLNQNKTLKKRQLSYSLKEKSTIFHQKADVYQRLSSLKQDRLNAKKVPTYLLKYSTNSINLRQKNPEGMTKSASATSILSPFQQRITSSPSNIKKKFTFNENTQELASIKMQLGLNSNSSSYYYSSSSKKASNMAQENIGSISQRARSSYANSSAKGRTHRGTSAKIMLRVLEVSQSKHNIPSSSGQKNDQLKNQDPQQQQHQQQNQQLIETQQITNISKKSKKPALINFYRQNNASRKLTSTALQDNIIVKMSAIASSTEQSVQEPSEHQRAKSPLDDIAILEKERSKSTRHIPEEEQEKHEKKSSLKDFSKSILSLHSHSQQMNETSLLSQDQDKSAFIKDLNFKTCFTSRFNPLNNDQQLRNTLQKQFRYRSASYIQQTGSKGQDKEPKNKGKTVKTPPIPKKKKEKVNKRCVSQSKGNFSQSIKEQSEDRHLEYLMDKNKQAEMKQDSKRDKRVQFNVIDFFDAVLKITKFQLDQLIPKERRVERRKKKFQVTSLFHYNNLKGLRILPQHRISTPKVSPMQPFNKHYKSPSINSQIFKTIDTAKYCRCMGFSQDQLSDCQVFLNDQLTTTVFTLVSADISSSCNSSSQQYLQQDQLPQLKLVASQNSQRSAPLAQQSNNFLPQDGGSMPNFQVPYTDGIARINLNSNQPQANRSKVKGSQIVHEIMTDCKVIIVIQDFYEDCLALRPFFQELANQLETQSTTFILCNLPGQAYTQYDPESSSLNNNYHANCLDLLLYYLQQRNQIDILTNPYSIIGFGSGVNIALNHAYSVSQTTGMLKGVLSFNGFSFMDDIMKDSIQNCIDTYQSCPQEFEKTHGDFYLRNLVLTTGTLLLSEHIKTLQKETAYSSSYASHCKILQALGEYGKQQDIQVTVAMMKQRQDAFVTGGQSKQAKIDICKGLLDYVDLKHSLSYLRVPIIIVQSRKNCFVHPNHSDAMRESGKKIFPEKQAKNNSHQVTEQVMREQERVKSNDIHRVIYQEIPRFQIFIDGGHNVLLQNPLKTKQIIMNFTQAPVKHTIKSALTKANSESQSNRGSLGAQSPILLNRKSQLPEISHFQKNFTNEQDKADN